MRISGFFVLSGLKDIFEEGNVDFTAMILWRYCPSVLASKYKDLKSKHKLTLNLK